ncbi:cytochrome c oxidase assembly protein (plasmid) [Aquamicrobium terrae]
MKRLSFIAGLAALVLIWAGPLLSVWRESFAAHMLAHMGVVAIAAPLIAIGVSDRIAAVRPSSALIASLVELVVVWGWHMPAARLWATSFVFATIVEQAMFLAAGLFLWLTALATAGGSTAQSASGAFALLLTSIHMTLLGALLALASRPLYGFSEVTCFGLVLDAEQDQALGGVVMLMVGAAVYLAGGVFLLSRLLSGNGQQRGAG